MGFTLTDRNGLIIVEAEVMREFKLSDTAYDFRRLVWQHEVRTWGWDLSDRDLSGSNFEGLNLDNASFRNSNLEDAEFQQGSIVQCLFNGASLVDAQLVQANFFECDFTGASFSGTIVQDADFFNSVMVDMPGLRDANGWEELARGNGKEVTAMQLGERQVTFVLDWAFVSCQQRPVHEFMKMSDAELLRHGGKDWLRWWKKYQGTLLEFVDAHNVRVADF